MRLALRLEPFIVEVRSYSLYYVSDTRNATLRLSAWTRTLSGHRSHHLVGIFEHASIQASSPLPVGQTSLSEAEGPAKREIERYCDLVHEMLHVLDQAGEDIAPNIRARIRHDIIVAHKRETRLMEALHGTNVLQDTMRVKSWRLADMDG